MAKTSYVTTFTSNGTDKISVSNDGSVLLKKDGIKWDIAQDSPNDAFKRKYGTGDSAPELPDQDGCWVHIEFVDGNPNLVTGYRVKDGFWSYWDDESQHVVDTLPRHGLWVFIV